ncbi:MAG: lipopolysaccharide kinase InaA family protein [Phycisphaerae bacterium]|nr:lipopolysaccharide kinase InaA family protein [Phycisphaerae bacterium]
MTDNACPHKTYQTYATCGWVVYAHQAYPRAITDLAVTVPDTVTLDPVEASPYARVVTGQVEADGTSYSVYVKQYLYRSVVDRLKHLIRPGRAMRNHTASVMLTRHGFLCPVVIATACYRPWGAGVPGLRAMPFCLASTTVTVTVTHAMPMDQYFSRLTDTDRRHAFLAALGREIGRLHGCRIFHGDLRVGNVLIEEAGDTWRFWLLDNERTCRFIRLPQRYRVKNLVQIHLFVTPLTRTDRWRFFRAYCDVTGMGVPRQKTLARQVMERTRQREQASPQRRPCEALGNTCR